MDCFLVGSGLAMAGKLTQSGYRVVSVQPPGRMEDLQSKWVFPVEEKASAAD
jgi:hypothetical protein